MRHLRMGVLLLAAIAAPSVWVAAQDRDSDRDRDRDRDREAASNAYQEGMREGREDATRNRRSPRSERWKNERDRRDYEAGYNRGYEDAMSANRRQGGYNQRGGPGGGVYGQGRGANWMEQARQIGYQDGVNDGASDHRTGHSFRPTHDDNYKHADRGYNSSFGDKNQYKQYYRQGYESGYQRGWNESTAGRR